MLQLKRTVVVSIIITIIVHYENNLKRKNLNFSRKLNRRQFGQQKCLSLEIMKRNNKVLKNPINRNRSISEIKFQICPSNLNVYNIFVQNRPYPNCRGSAFQLKSLLSLLNDF